MHAHRQPDESDPATREARQKAIGMYRKLAVVQGLLGIGLLVCGGLGTQHGDESFGPPFYLGGFLVGFMMLLSTWMCIRIGSKRSDSDFTNQVQRQEVASSMMCQQVTAMLTFMACFMGLMFTTVMDSCTFMNSKPCSPEREKIRYAIIGGMVVAILSNVYAIFILCSYGNYFGVVMSSRYRGNMIVIQHPGDANVFGVNQATGFGQSGTGMYNPRLQQLERENELLRQNLELQKQQSPPYTGAGFSSLPAAPPPSYSNLGGSK